MLRILDIAGKCILGAAFVLAMLASRNGAEATGFKVLHTFSGGNDGCIPVAGLIFDAAGNLFGTTAGNDSCSHGTVFKLAPGGTETVLYNFPGGKGGAGPDGTLVMDKKGTLYGTTLDGGIGCGVVFKVPSNGAESVIHTFAGSPDDGCSPTAALIMDNSGNIFGTTNTGGKNNGGTVFELAVDGTEKILYSFCRRAHCADGESPFAGVVADSAGNFYGATQSGGKLGCGNECGTVFKLAPDGTETVLYKFRGPPNDGNNPDGNLLVDQSGNFYGTLFGGRLGSSCAYEGCGAVFKLALDGTETVLRFFTGRKGDGANPNAGLIADNAGNLYGTTVFGGGRGCTVITIGCGTVFELGPGGTETVLHSFGKGSHGANPYGGLVADGAGNLYGTTSQGGADGFGTVFEIIP